MFTCPVCHRPLERGEHSARCENSHSFDIAREGYVYLLPPNKKHSKNPGDTAAMVRARRYFLQTGGYALFRKELCRLAAGYCTRDNPRVLDVGCGEGYYTAALPGALPHAGIAGMDISKYAVRLAAKKLPELCFAVASCFDLPVAANDIDLVVNLFSPLVPQELRRVLRPGGIFLLAVPGPRHLYGLKELIYEAPYENMWKETDYEGFALLERTVVEGTLKLNDPEVIQSLFAMTPYYWKTDAAGSARVSGAQQLTTPISFHFLVYQKIK